MTTITLTNDRAGLASFPADFTLVGRDDSGNPLAVDAEGRVCSFAHGAGDWSQRTLAFASLQELQQFVAFQPQLSPAPDASLAELQACKNDVEAFAKTVRRSPLARDALREALAELRERLADARFRGSKRGRSLALRQELGQQCERALQAAGAPGTWMVRAHAERAAALCVVGPWTAPWDEARVRALLQPLVGDHELVCLKGR